MKRPYVIINSAASLDGKISTVERKQIAISSEGDFQRVEELRKEFDAIMVGIGTILADNPSLYKEGLIRVVVDSKGRIPKNSRVFKGSSPTIVAVSDKADSSKIESINQIGEVIKVSGHNEKVNLVNLMKRLYDRGIEKIMVEGGGTINWSIVKNGIFDEIRVYTGNMILGGEKAPTLVDGKGFNEVSDAINLELKDLYKMDEGFVSEWIPK